MYFPPCNNNASCSLPQQSSNNNSLNSLSPLLLLGKIRVLLYSIEYTLRLLNRMDIHYFNRKAPIIPIFQNTPLPLSRSKPDDLSIQERKELPNQETDIKPHQGSIVITLVSLSIHDSCSTLPFISFSLICQGHSTPSAPSAP